jgi:epoxyqueuosine reductase QueG
LPDAKTVVTYFIPFDDVIVKSNIKGKEASRRWALAYVETNQLIHELNMFVNSELKKSGYNSTIIPATHNFDKIKLISDWSHRHVAYISGLGGFGLNNMLITDKGCCGRVGSLVTNLRLEPTQKKVREYCLYKYNGTCKKCVDRCENHALTVGHYDRSKCYGACLDNYKIFGYMGLTDVCGKCLVGLPCSTTNPVKLRNA